MIIEFVEVAAAYEIREAQFDDGQDEVKVREKSNLSRRDHATVPVNAEIVVDANCLDIGWKRCQGSDILVPGGILLSVAEVRLYRCRRMNVKVPPVPFCAPRTAPI